MSGIKKFLSRIRLRWHWPIEIEQADDDGTPIPGAITIFWYGWRVSYYNGGDRKFLTLGPIEIQLWAYHSPEETERIEREFRDRMAKAGIDISRYIKTKK
jgi:hypothetical protein